MNIQSKTLSAGVRVLRWGKVAEKIGTHVSTVRRWASDDPKYAHLGFPKPIELGDGSGGFIESEIDDWLLNRPRVEAS
ncbi:MAG: helix-turn-helix transcriptional regulator [Pseudomonadota bacterium]